MTIVQQRMLTAIKEGRLFTAYNNSRGHLCFREGEPSNVLYITLTLRVLLKKNLIKINPETSIVEAV